MNPAHFFSTRQFILVLLGFFLGGASCLPAQDSCPCCTPEHRQFDFWLGDWEAFKGDTDTLAGTNHIVLLQDQCILQENWASAQGNFTGTSYNWWDGSQWNQAWVDNQGGSLLLAGQWTGEKMILESAAILSKNGKPYYNRVTWTPHSDGSVRQLWEISRDEKVTWSTIFDGLYKKKG